MCGAISKEGDQVGRHFRVAFSAASVLHYHVLLVSFFKFIYFPLS